MFIFKRRLSTFLQLNENTRAIQNVCRVLAENELKPVASQHDKLAKCVQNVQCHEYKTHWIASVFPRFPQKQIEELAKNGFLGACVDKKYGGKGLDFLTLTLAIEEFSRCCASTGIIVSIHNCLYADLIQNFGTPEQIQSHLIPYTNGRLGVFALSENGKFLLEKWNVREERQKNVYMCVSLRQFMKMLDRMQQTFQRWQLGRVTTTF